jgi:DNA polymerase III epsilon subunit-like protein
MLKNIALERPLAVIDLETTGTDPKTNRIIEVSVLKLTPGGEADHRTRRVNPGVPIPPEATAVHGISDDDVADCPPSGRSHRAWPDTSTAATWPASTSCPSTSGCSSPSPTGRA